MKSLFYIVEVCDGVVVDKNGAAWSFVMTPSVLREKFVEYYPDSEIDKIPVSGKSPGRDFENSDGGPLPPDMLDDPEQDRVNQGAGGFKLPVDEEAEAMLQDDETMVDSAVLAALFQGGMNTDQIIKLRNKRVI